MDEKIKKLFTPFNIGKEKIKNRFVVAPMGVPAYVDSNGAFTERGMQYFVERAKGGFGLIYTGVMLVDNEVEPMSPPSFLNHPEIFYPAATRLNERLSSYGAKFFCEVGLGVGRTYPTFKSPSPAEVFGYPQRTSPASIYIPSIGAICLISSLCPLRTNVKTNTAGRLRTRCGS